MNSQWKQPTPTDIRHNENVDLLSRLLFFDILNGCQNKPYHKIYYHGNKRIDLELKRGQYLFVVSRYARDLGISRRNIEKSLRIVSKWYTELHIERKPFGLIVTVKDYDELTKMHNEMQIKRKTNVKRTLNERKSNNKSDKSGKSEESDKETSNDEDKKSYGNKDLVALKKSLIRNYPKPLGGITDSRKLYNLKQILSKRKNQDEWMNDDWTQNFLAFLKLYLSETEEQYLVASVDNLKEKAKLWREYRGKLS